MKKKDKTTIDLFEIMDKLEEIEKKIDNLDKTWLKTEIPDLNSYNQGQIYESPDGGKTVFQRPVSNYDPEQKKEIDWETKEPTGRTFTDYPYNTEFGDGKSNKEMESIDTENKTLPNMKWYKNYKKKNFKNEKGQ